MNEKQISIQEADKKVFRSAFDDGLVDIFLSSIVLMWATAPYLSTSIGDLWSSVIFLPLWGLVFLVLYLIRKYWIKPRTGVVNYGVARKKKLSSFTWIMLVLNIVFFILGVMSFLTPGGTGWTRMLPFTLMLLICFSLAGYFLDVTRFYIYGLLWAGGFYVGEWLYQTYHVPHHGYPVVFGVLCVLILLTGLYKLFSFIRSNPLPPEEQLRWEAKNG